jgi:hypothetical protein
MPDWLRFRPMHRLIIAGLGVVLLAGCSDGSGRSTANPSGSDPVMSSPPPLVAHDPATRFASDEPIALPGQVPAGTKTPILPVALGDMRAYTIDGGQLRAVELATGKVTWSAAPQTSAPPVSPGSSSSDEGTWPPVLGSLDGTPVVAAAFPATIAGQGTAASGPAVELLVVNATSGQEVWRTRLDSPPGDAADGLPPGRVVGLDDATVVVQAGTAVYGADLRDRRIVWTKRNLTAQVVVDHLAVGVEPAEIATPQKITAVRVTGGQSAWSTHTDSFQISLQAAGPRLIAVNGQDYGSGARYFTLLRSADGSPARRRETAGRFAATTCRYDQVAMTVCSGSTPGGAWAIGVDAASGRQLWSLPQAGRVAPTVTAVWHGTVYGTTKDNGPIALDARSGADRPGPVGIAPMMVNTYAGLELRDGRVLAHRSIG